MTPLAFYDYDLAGRRIGETSPTGVESAMEYDSLGRVITMTIDPPDGPAQITRQTYDRFDQVLTVTQPDHTVSVPRAETRTYDAWGSLTSQGGTGQYPITYEYDAVGNRTALVDGNNSRTTWAYNARNQVQRKTYADNSSYQYTYDAVGNLLTRLDAKGITTNYAYNNPFHQLSTVDYPADVDVTFTYDTLGRRTTMTDGTGTTSWSYDSLGRLGTNTQPGVDRSLLYGYDTYGQRTAMQILNTQGSPSTERTLTISYDSASRLRSLRDDAIPGSGTFTYEYNAQGGWISKLDGSSGAQTTKSHDALGRLTGTNFKNGSGNVINNFAYTYDLANQRTQEAGTVGTRNFAYNDKRELTSAQGTNNHAYSYDSIGNRTQATNNGQQTAYQANSLNQYTQITQNSELQTPNYDSNGNMLADGNRSLEWDQENRLIRVTYPNGNKSEFTYDGLSRRVETREYQSGSLVSTTRYLYDGLLPVAELNASNAVTRTITRGLDLSGSMQGAGGIGGILATNGNEYSYDGNGNVRDIISSSGINVAHYEYDPFGNKTVSSGSYSSQPYQWSSKEFHQPSGLVYYLYRFYSPELGRWINRDPIEEYGGVLLYGYCSNDSNNRIDKYGENFIYTILEPLARAALQGAAAVFKTKIEELMLSYWLTGACHDRLTAGADAYKWYTTEVPRNLLDVPEGFQAAFLKSLLDSITGKVVGDSAANILEDFKVFRKIPEYLKPGGAVRRELESTGEVTSDAMRKALLDGGVKEIQGYVKIKNSSDDCSLQYQYGWQAELSFPEIVGSLESTVLINSGENKSFNVRSACQLK